MVHAQPIDPIYSNNLKPKVKSSGTDFLNTLSMTAGYTGGVGIALAQNHGSAKTQNIVHAAVTGAAYPGSAGLSALSSPYAYSAGSSALINSNLPGSIAGSGAKNDMIAMAEAQHEMGQVDTARLLMVQDKIGKTTTQNNMVASIIDNEKRSKQEIVRKI